MSRNKPKRKNTMKEKKTGSSPGRDLNLHPKLPPAKIVRLHITGSCDHCTNSKLKLIVLKYFSLPFTRFEPCGAVFMMNSKIHLSKNSLNEYFKAILHYFRVHSLSGFIMAAR